ncbi:T-cell surface glycoprotein CD3 gamma chain-like isoform X3 [Sceloporus undulatus]|uniref:T-cell surface glycoprotein CD3 gamma chain-like isoform X3 n=1 Tax=Sceloporus undulatus TaxID=8520 RepID=UPI001C4C1253|nr:T-cell surface glycoprotein CD3 gamma chain-like isoform X3 [Sceloporus undulatus]XP_042332895.1 T-cell surface glycoprotein CD3 gamma chain-like isoform X3 [Sceloporus undulatus]
MHSKQPRQHSDLSSSRLFCRLGNCRLVLKEVARASKCATPKRDSKMGRGWSLWPAAVLGLFFTGIFTGNPESGQDLAIIVKPKGTNITLECKGGSSEIKWKKDGNPLNNMGKELALGSAMDDPRGFYQCYEKDPKKNASLQVFFRMCQNCVHLNLPTILGILLASLVATLFLAFPVYCIAVEEPSRRSQVASDKQNLLANEQLYQPLGERNNGQYSHVGVGKTRHR